MTTTMDTGAASLSDERERAAITACALMIKGICLTRPNAEWTGAIEDRIQFMLKQMQAGAAIAAGGAQEAVRLTDVESWAEGAKFALRAIAKHDICFLTDSMKLTAVKLATDACVAEKDRLIAAPSVEQDERGAFDESEWRALFNSTRTADTTFEQFCGWMREEVTKARAASTSANVAQGAAAVATVKVYETYTGQNGWIEVTQEEYDRTKDKYEHRIRRVSAPPAQTALTDDARDAARYRTLRKAGAIVEWTLAGPWKHGDALDRIVDASAQSASGDTK
jgi:hypothetical protein